MRVPEQCGQEHGDEAATGAVDVTLATVRPGSNLPVTTGETLAGGCR